MMPNQLDAAPCVGFLRGRDSGLFAPRQFSQFGRCERETTSLNYVRQGRGIGSKR